METHTKGLAADLSCDLKNFLRGMETHTSASRPAARTALKNFLRGMETQVRDRAVPIIEAPSKTSLEGWKLNNSLFFTNVARSLKNFLR